MLDEAHTRVVDLSNLVDSFPIFLTATQNLKPSTLRIHAVNLRHILSFFQTSENLTLTKTRQYYIQLKNEYATNTVNQRVATLRHVFEHCIELGLVKENYAKELNLKMPPKRLNVDTLTPEEIEAIINAPIDYNSDDLSYQYEVLYKTLAETGMRISEVTGLKVKNIDFVQDLIRISETKTDEARIIPVNRNLKKELETITKEKARDSFVFLNSRGTPFDRSYVYVDLKRRCKLLGITKKVTPHTFRHTFATSMLANGSPLPQVQAILGHASIQTTERYIHLEIKSLHEAINRYHPLVKKARTPNQIFEDIELAIKSSLDLSDPKIKHEIIKSESSIKLSIEVA